MKKTKKPFCCKEGLIADKKFIEQIHSISQAQKKQQIFHLQLCSRVDQRFYKVIERAFIFIFTDSIEWPPLFNKIISDYKVINLSKLHNICPLLVAILIDSWVSNFHDFLDFVEDVSIQEKLVF